MAVFIKTTKGSLIPFDNIKAIVPKSTDGCVLHTKCGKKVNFDLTPEQVLESATEFGEQDTSELDVIKLAFNSFKGEVDKLAMSLAQVADSSHAFQREAKQELDEQRDYMKTTLEKLSNEVQSLTNSTRDKAGDYSNAVNEMVSVTKERAEQITTQANQLSSVHTKIETQANKLASCLEEFNLDARVV